MATAEERWEEASRAYGRAVEGKPEDPELQFLAGKAFYWRAHLSEGGQDPGGRQGAAHEAFLHVKRCLSKDPEHSRALDLLVKILRMGVTDEEEGIALLAGMIEQWPQRLDLAFALADLLERAGQDSRSERLWEGLAAQSTRPDLAHAAQLRLVGAKDRKAQSTYRAGVQAFENGHKDEGAKLITEAIRQTDSPELKATFEASLRQRTQAPVITFTGGLKGPPKKGKP